MITTSQAIQVRLFGKTVGYGSSQISLPMGMGPLAEAIALDNELSGLRSAYSIYMGRLYVPVEPFVVRVCKDIRVMSTDSISADRKHLREVVLRIGLMGPLNPLWPEELGFLQYWLGDDLPAWSRLPIIGETWR